MALASFYMHETSPFLFWVLNKCGINNTPHHFTANVSNSGFSEGFATSRSLLQSDTAFQKGLSSLLPQHPPWLTPRTS